MKPTEVNPVFDPALQPVFSVRPVEKVRFEVKNSRDLFYSLIHISENYSVLPLAHHYLTSYFHYVNTQCAACFSQSYSDGCIDQLLTKPGFEPSATLLDATLNGFLVQYAPVFLTEFSWLPATSQTVCCQNPLVVDLMAMYLRLTKDAQSIGQVRAELMGYLAAFGIQLPVLHTYEFAAQPEVVEEIFDFAAVQLALGQFPRVFFPEILGFTLACCHSLTLLEHCFAFDNKDKPPDFLAQRKVLHRQEFPAIKAIIQAYLADSPIRSDELWQRIQCGYWLNRLLTAQCSQQIAVKVQTTLSPRQAMHQLLLSLMPNAVGHHGNSRLGGKTIDEWFKEKPFKSENFLATLLHSPLVDRIRPEHSQLLKLYDFRGPMFGVLDGKGKAVIKEWLLSELNPDDIPRKKTQVRTLKSRSYAYGLKKLPSEPERIEISFDTQHRPGVSVKQPDYRKLSNNTLYFYLINSGLYPEVLSAAKNKVRAVLRMARLFSRLPFRDYTHSRFENYINAVYQNEVKRYKPLTNKPKLAKAGYAWGIEQFAPTILTDGSWLQSIYQLAFSSSHHFSQLLGKIYEDEIGNGIREQNHPYIYQQLLDSLGIKLPPIDSKAFGEHQGFIGGAFDIPVYLMAIAKFPATFLPELLGLNMAIELSGLGNQYLRLSQALRYWGIDSAIVDIHTSIDNLSSGHSALAKKAIRLYLDDIDASCGRDEVNAHWQRIYTGYRSLQTVSNRFKFSLIWNYFLKRTTANYNYDKQP